MVDIHSDLFSWYGMSKAINIMLARIETLVLENNNLKNDYENSLMDIRRLREELDIQDRSIFDLRGALENCKSELEILKKTTNKFSGSITNWENIAHEVANKYNHSAYHRIAMIKDFRKITGSSLKEAKDLIDKIVPFEPELNPKM